MKMHATTQVHGVCAQNTNKQNTSIAIGEVVGLKRSMTFPSLSTKNLVKFHFILLPKYPVLLALRNLYMGSVFGPLTRT